MYVTRCELFQIMYHWAEVEMKILLKLLFSIAPWLLVSFGVRGRSAEKLP